MGLDQLGRPRARRQASTTRGLAASPKGIAPQTKEREELTVRRALRTTPLFQERVGGKAKNRRSQSAGAVAEPGAATELARRRARKSSERAAGAARKERGHEARGTCLDVRRVLSVHGEKSVKTGRRDEDPSYEKTLLSEYLR